MLIFRSNIKRVFSFCSQLFYCLWTTSLAVRVWFINTVLIQQRASFTKKPQALRKAQKPLSVFPLVTRVLRLTLVSSAWNWSKQKWIVTITVLNPLWKTDGSVNVFLTGWSMIFVNPQQPQNMCYTLDFHLAEDLVTIMYGVSLFCLSCLCQNVHVSIQTQPQWGKLCYLAWMFPSLFIFKHLFECWILGNFLSLHQELRHCPKNLLKKQVQIWEESVSFLLYKSI